MLSLQNETDSTSLNTDDRTALHTVFMGVPEIEEVVLFGSRAMGTAKQGSDIDLALKGAHLRRETLVRVRSALSDLPLTPYFFDVVNYHTIDNVALREHIDTKGVPLYRRGA